MAIDRITCWVFREHSADLGVPATNTGYQFASAAELAQLISDGCAVDIRETPYRELPHIQKLPPFSKYTPQDLAASPVSPTQIDLTWSDVNSAPNEDSYEVERSEDGGETWAQVHVSAQDATGWSDTTVVAGTDYVYQVRANMPGGDSPWSPPARASTPPF